MLDYQANEKLEAKKKGSSRKRSSSGHERRDSQGEGEGEGGAKRRKVNTKRDIEKIDYSEKPTESENDEMSQMRGMHSTFKRFQYISKCKIFSKLV